MEPKLPLWPMTLSEHSNAAPGDRIARNPRRKVWLAAVLNSHGWLVWSSSNFNMEPKRLSLYSGSTGLSPPCQITNRVNSKNSKKAPCYLFTRIDNRAVTVGSPSLQIFQRDSRHEEGAGNGNNAVRIREIKERSEAGKRDNVLKAGEGPHIWLQQ
jgi:hypothetical protein